MQGKLTPEEALAKLQEIKTKQDARKIFGDLETEHIKADNILCDLLRFYQQDEIVEVFNSLDKWYA